MGNLLHDISTHLDDGCMVGNRVVGMESGDNLLGRLEQLLILFLLLIHFFFILFLLPVNLFQSFCNHIVNISGFFVDDPSVLYFFWLESELVFLQQSIHLRIFLYLYSDFLHLHRCCSIKIIFQLTCFFNINRNFLDFSLDFSKLFKLFVG